MAQSDVFDFLVNMSLSTGQAKNDAEEFRQKLIKIFKETTKINIADNLDLKGLQAEFQKVGAVVNSVFDFSGAKAQLKELNVQLDDFQKRATSTTIDMYHTVGGTSVAKVGETKVSGVSLSEQKRDIQELTKLMLEEEQAARKVQEAQQSGDKVVEAYANSVYKAAVQEHYLAQTSFEQKYGGLSDVPEMWQKIADAEDLALQKLAADKSIEQKEKEVKDFQEALNALVQAQEKMNSLWVQGKGGTDEFAVNLAQWTSAKSTLESYGATVDTTSVSITKNSKIVQENQGAFEGLDKATKEATLSLIKSDAQMGDTANAKAQQTAIDNFEKALSKLVSTQQRMRALEGQGKTNTEEYKALTAQYNTAKSTLESYGATVTATNVTITQNSNVVQGNSKGYQELSQKTQEASDKLQIYKAKADDAVTATQNANQNQKTFSETIQGSIENFIKYQVAMEAINKITSEFTSAIYDMNEAMTQVRMVTMGSYEDTVALADSYTKLAKQLGTTTTTVAEGADAWLKCLGQVKSL